MDTKKEINSLAAETLAFSAIIAQVLGRLASTSVEMQITISKGFDDAACVVEQLAITTGKAASPDHTVKALQIVETMRTATLGDHDQPKHGV